MKYIYHIANAVDLGSRCVSFSYCLHISAKEKRKKTKIPHSHMANNDHSAYAIPIKVDRYPPHLFSLRRVCVCDRFRSLALAHAKPRRFVFVNLINMRNMIELANIECLWSHQILVRYFDVRK